MTDRNLTAAEESYDLSKTDGEDIGHGVRVAIGSHGAIVRHSKPDGRPCILAVWFADAVDEMPNRPVWQRQSKEPLTLSPSIACLSVGCGLHGYIRDGKWAPA